MRFLLAYFFLEPVAGAFFAGLFDFAAPLEAFEAAGFFLAAFLGLGLAADFGLVGAGAFGFAPTA